MSKNAQTAHQKLVAEATRFQVGYGDISVVVSSLLAEYRKGRRELAQAKRRAEAAEQLVADIVNLADKGIVVNDSIAIDSADLDALLDGCANR